MSIGIYKIENPSGKIYIGQSINIEKRFKQYLRLDCKKQPKIYNSLKKYTPNNHIFEIIEICDLCVLNEKEIFWKIFFNSIEEGLNCELFDIGQGFRSQQTKDKISKSLLGLKKTEEHKQNISISKLGIPSKRKGKPDLKQKGKPKPGAGGKNLPKIGAGPKNGNSIIDVSTNIIYTSIKQCMDINNINKTKMFKLLKDNNSNFKYINKNYWKNE